MILFLLDIYPIVGLLDLLVVLFLILWGSIHSIFHNGYTNLRSHQQCISVPFTSYPCSHLSFFVILVMISDVKHIFIYPLAICASSLKKMPVWDFCSFLNQVFFCFLLFCWLLVAWVPFIFGYKPLIRCVVLLFHRLSFHFVICFLCTVLTYEHLSLM